MKIAIIILTILFTVTSCEKGFITFLKNNNYHKIIALQPLGKYNEQQLVIVQNQLSSYFNMRVVILKPVAIPETFRIGVEEKYSGDSLVNFLSGLCNDTIVEVVGLTHKDIYTLHEYTYQQNNKRIATHGIKGIFGIGYVPGNSCVISDYRIMSEDKELLNNRLRKVIIHEIGHNLGLQHCSVDTCIMSESNGNMSVLNKMGGSYCKKCSRKL